MRVSREMGEIDGRKRTEDGIDLESPALEWCHERRSNTDRRGSLFGGPRGGADGGGSTFGVVHFGLGTDRHRTHSQQQWLRDRLWAALGLFDLILRYENFIEGRRRCTP